jgi:hypothetical protein
MQDRAMQESREVASKANSKDRGWAIFLLGIVILLVSGYFIVASQKLYKPGDDIGYNLGLVGGIMLLSLLLYPLRKRVKIFRSVGILPGWFKWHMVLGILAPAMILFHATFHISSINAGVALVCMLLVSGSGTFGRFFYTKIHHGLYGRQTTVNELKADLEQSGEVKSTFAFAPEIENKLAAFRTHAEQNAQAGKLGLWKFIAIGIQTERLSKTLSNELHSIMHAQANEKNFTPAQISSMEKMFAEYSEQISFYLKAVRDASQFHTYERLFSYWHIFHIPLVYMMVFSGFYHVYAVHAY